MLFTIIKKELLLVRRDIHALMVLFIMPMAFILIMSLSLQDTFQQSAADKIKIGLVFANSKEKDTPLGKSLLKLSGFQTLVYPERDVLFRRTQADNLAAAIILPEKFRASLQRSKKVAPQDRLQLYYSPTTPSHLRKLILASVIQALASYQLDKMLARMLPDPALQRQQKQKFTGGGLINQQELYGERQLQPTSVQQSVPAWLIFSIFFVVIPIATTFLTEKQHGTLQRLKTLPVPNSYFLVGKLVPYLGINLIQTALMFLVGIYLVPALGGEGLVLHSNAWLLLPMSISVSVTAISFALLVAVLVKTTEQATTIGGISNLLLAAAGGIMVPTFIMPEIMQHIARYSPMNWGLEGFLTILLRQGDLVAILPEMGKLLVLAGLLFCLAVVAYRRRLNA